MNKSIFAACAVVSLCGTSYGFSLLTFGQPPEQDGGGAPIVQKDIKPSSGMIRLAEVLDGSSTTASYVPEFNNNTYGLVTGTGTIWSSSRAAINNSSWFAGDSTGPDGAYTSGVGATNRPAWNAGYASNPVYTGFGTPTGPTWVGAGDGDNLVSSIDGGIPGWAFAFDIAPLDDGPLTGIVSNISPLGGLSVMHGQSYDWAESVFVGRITLTDPSAYLKGSVLVLLRDYGPPTGFEVNLNGASSLGMRMIQVRDGDSINLFLVEVPAPGALGVMGVAGVMGVRRRRR